MNAVYRCITIFIISILTIPTLSQSVILEEYPEKEYTAPLWGHNRTHSIQIVGAYGHFVNSRGEEVSPFMCQTNALLFQYKLRINQFFSIVNETGFSEEYFRMKGNRVSTFDGNTYKHETLKTQSGETFFGLRINPDIKRGNIIGKYLEFGFYGNYLMSSRRITRSTGNTSTDFFKNKKVIEKGLSFFNPVQYGIALHIGLNQYGLFYRYSLTEWFKSEGFGAVLPSQSFGIRFAFLN